jgi:nitroreductase/NAD-dependent dihydropyrimidine dehydrogenase PreA subunit
LGSIAGREHVLNLFVVDPDKCKRDGICVGECPVQIIELKNRASLPELIPGGAELCINCGHCVSVCPHGAMSLKTMPLEQCPPLNRATLPTQQQIDHFLRSRRSSRVYKNNPLDKKILASLIDIARFAPSGHNLQPVCWVVIQEKKELKRLAGIVIDWMRVMIDDNAPIARAMHFDRAIDVWDKGTDRILRDAPCLIIAHGRSDLSASQPACLIALTYLELAAYSYGLGACWAGYFNAAANFHKPMQDALALPEGHQCFGAMMIGYPKNKYYRLPMRNEANIDWR